MSQNFHSSIGREDIVTATRGKNDCIEDLPNWGEDELRKCTVDDDELPHLPDGFKIMFAGNLGEAQNLENVMRVAERLKNNKHIQWIFIGDGRKKKWVMSFVQSREMGDTVHFYDRYPIEYMPAFSEKPILCCFLFVTIAHSM